MITKKQFSDSSEAREHLIMLQLAEEEELSPAKVKEEKVSLEAAKVFKSPAKHIKPEVLQQIFDEALADMGLGNPIQTLESEMGKLGEEEGNTPTMQCFLSNLTAVVTTDQQSLCMPAGKVNHLLGQIGVPFKNCPPTVWSGMQVVMDDCDAVKMELGERKRKWESLEAECQGTEKRLHQSVDMLSEKTRNTCVELNSMLEVIKERTDAMGANKESSPAPASFLEKTHAKRERAKKRCGVAWETEDNVDKWRVVEERVMVLEQYAHSLSQDDKSAQAQGIRIRRFYFADLDELSAWMESSLPPSAPFGAFVDVYSFLERMTFF
mmetsp:Transcript_639/g.1022  ORF Transcript_639/g.1022 Transcript_639/m.1022 type:complete len:323 (+) Transcript_639:273-1241(+)